MMLRPAITIASISPRSMLYRSTRRALPIVRAAGCISWHCHCQHSAGRLKADTIGSMAGRSWLSISHMPYEMLRVIRGSTGLDACC